VSGSVYLRLCKAAAVGETNRVCLAGGAYHQRNLISSYSCSLGWLADRGLLDWDLAPGERWRDEVLEQYIRHLEATYSKATVAHRLRYLELALATLDPMADRELLHAALFRLGRPGRNRSKDAHIVLSHRLLQLGLDMMDEADASYLSPASAGHYRTGLQIASMAIVPWRIGEFSRLTVGSNRSHIYQIDNRWRIRISALETKNRVSGRDVLFPKSLVKRLELYLNIYREELRGGHYEGDAVWLSTRAQPQGSHTIWWHFKKRTGSSPHAFRRAAATTMAIYAPTRMEAVMSCLGQTSTQTRDEHYNLAGSFSASLQLNDVNDAILSSAKEWHRLGRRK
jgi:integrase